MLKFLLAAYRSRQTPRNAEIAEQFCFQWWRDPLSHPVIEGMNERELGDLPFRR